MQKHMVARPKLTLTFTPFTVDPTSEAGHNLFLQFQNKKGKVILDARWITACVHAKKLVTYKGDWAGFRVKGHERYASCHQHATWAPNVLQIRLPSKPWGA